MADIAFMELNDRFRLAFDRLQWIIQRRERTTTEERSGWVAESFISSDKTVLLRCLEERGCQVAQLSDEAGARLKSLPETFKEWFEQTGKFITEERNKT